MRIFAIGDLHLPGGDQKPMDVFGAHWERHFERICEDWRMRVGARDVVLIPGDISWAMRFEDALPDLNEIAALPGQKILLRGNHDYWWGSIGRLRQALPEGMYAVQNDCVPLGGVVFCGSRGWTIPQANQPDAEDAKIYARELIRLKLSLDQAKRHGLPMVALLHYPPMNERYEASEVTRMLSEYGVCEAVYGHLHGAALKGAFDGMLDGVRYHQVSCDGLGFRVKELSTTGKMG